MMAPPSESSALLSNEGNVEIKHYDASPSSGEGNVDSLESHVSKEASRSAADILEAPFRVRVPGQQLQAEATAWAMDAAAKAPISLSAAFLGPALLTLANENAQIDCQRDNDTCDDEGRIYGLRPSSILAASSVLVALGVALLMPLMGAMIDYSPHRRTVGAATAGILVVLNACPMLLSSTTWSSIWVTHALSDFCYIVHTVILLAYLYNLSSDQNVIATYTSRFTIIHFLVMTLYLLTVIQFASFRQTDRITTARFAHALSSTVSGLLLGYAWTKLFGNRPPLHQLPKGTSLLTMGMSRIRSTTKLVWKHYPALKWFLITLLFSPDAGSGQLLAIMSTFETEFMHMTAAQIGTANLLTLISTIPGGLLSQRLCHGLDALTSFRLCLFCWAAVPMLAAWTVQGPNQVFPWFYGCRVLWGVSLGWLLPTQRVLFCTLVPPGQETEMMGLLLCFHSILAWLPPLVFGFINELGLSMRYGLVSANSVFLLALLFSIGIGDYRNAVRQARDPDKASDSEQATFTRERMVAGLCISV